MKILAIESSCDETACAVIRDGTEILSSVVASSTAMHEKWGGIVPEVAAREQLTSMIPVLMETLSSLTCHAGLDPASQPNKEKLDSCWSLPRTSLRGRNDIKEVIQNNIDAIAVTVGPGLIGSLLIGVETAKTLAFVTGKPIIPVNHVLAHIYANFLKTENRKQKTENEILRLPCLAGRQASSVLPASPTGGRLPEFPAISLVVSGGHTELFLMKNEKDLKWLGGTIDDAAGEAFDKSARLLGFGHGGGLAIQESAKLYCHPALDAGSRINKKIDSCWSLPRTSLRGRNDTYVTISLPRPMMHDETLNFSFSGLKTAVMREANKLKKNKQFNDKTIEQLSYEVQEAITDVLVAKTLKAAKLHNAKSILISGGVASNERLRNKLISTMKQLNNITIAMPPASLCTDNAAFIGSYAFFRGEQEDWHNITAIPDLSVEE
jgi:N6-L-threonylcarbamoyladenine synthase